MKQPFTTVRGPAAILPQADIDTDVIIRIERLTGGGGPAELGRWAFEALRYDEDGAERPDFPFNVPATRTAPILVAGPNFGCGSSREGAVLAIAGLGVKAILAQSFGDIFYANCFQAGVLPIRLGAGEIARCMAEADDVEVDLERQQVRIASGAIPFAIAPLRRDGLLLGLDDIGLSLRDGEVIRAWQSRDRANRPWVWDLPPGLPELPATETMR